MKILGKVLKFSVVLPYFSNAIFWVYTKKVANLCMLKQDLLFIFNLDKQDSLVNSNLYL